MTRMSMFRNSSFSGWLSLCRIPRQRQLGRFLIKTAGCAWAMAKAGTAPVLAQPSSGGLRSCGTTATMLQRVWVAYGRVSFQVFCQGSKILDLPDLRMIFRRTLESREAEVHTRTQESGIRWWWWCSDSGNGKRPLPGTNHPARHWNRGHTGGQVAGEASTAHGRTDAQWTFVRRCRHATGSD